MRNHVRKQKGVTIIEIFIIIVVLVVLAVIVIPQFGVSIREKQITALEKENAALSGRITLLEIRHGIN